jgi:hemoglobin
MCEGQRVTSNSASHSCACSGQPVGEVGRKVDAATELILPAVAFPSRRVLDTAGEERLRQLVRHHHALLVAGPIGSMFPADADLFADLVDKVADFVVESCGGGAAYSAQHGSTCMRTRHFPFTIDESARETWLSALFRAMEDVDFPIEVREEYWNWLEAMSVRMINRRTMKAQPARIPFAMAQLRFGGHAGEGMPCGVGMHFCPHG